MQVTRYLIILAATWIIAASSFTSSAHGKTIYSVTFDYRAIPSSSIYFTGKTPQQIDRLCKTGEHASNADLAACEQRDFERLSQDLNSTYSKILGKVKEADEESKESGDPLAGPDFIGAQDNWVKYRDNYCYAYVYAIGEASARYIDFWGCMKELTLDRTRQLEKFLDAG
ncbi:lysozyme inhibitor LprI family protein [Paraburkholderia antibiotica]|uniref:DUF1311 domain-containing protein n=1 Tax=Paraburkholderia antibiotica TaxID=2728839 RepID=A0A7X9ZVS6_9BURK|nr:lysozyme inhibitor LprI family protein [Paraburkholderia antibiotica]NML30217.1 DUF1311 domain-containing protein [Paraburkholderia antibiotica]